MRKTVVTATLIVTLLTSLTPAAFAAQAKSTQPAKTTTKAKTTAKAPAPKPKAAAPAKKAPSRDDILKADASKLISHAMGYIGTRYKTAGMSPSGFDCSGFTSYVFKNALGITLPHSSKSQSTLGTAVAKADLREGDIVYFNTNGKGVSHVGIYIGNNKFIHASSKGIAVTSLSEAYYVKRYMGARRILK